jgi:ribonuclease Z
MISSLRRAAVLVFATLSWSATYANTQVIMLGTGTPVPDGSRAGAGVAVVVDGTAYLFDAGSGVHHRAIQAMERYQIPGLNPQEMQHVFLTHLHSDHIHDVDNFAISRWWSRAQSLDVYGPVGLQAYTDHMNAMAKVEADLRSAGTPPQLIVDREGYMATAHEIQPGVVFENEQIKIEAFSVPHRPSAGLQGNDR